MLVVLVVLLLQGGAGWCGSPALSPAPCPAHSPPQQKRFYHASREEEITMLSSRRPESRYLLLDSNVCIYPSWITRTAH